MLHRNIVNRKVRRGFSMVELLAVIGIISVMAVLIGVSFGGGNETISLGNGQRIAASMFQSARMIAASKQTPARVIIYAEQSGDSTTDPKKFLRYMGVVYEDNDPDNSIPDGTWVPANQGTYLPEGVFFMPGTKPDGLVAADEVTRHSSKPSSSPDEIPDGTFSFPVRGTDGENFYYYEFDSNGMSENPGGTFILRAGRRTGPNEVTIENKFAVAGFAIRRTGGVTLFNDHEEVAAL